MLEDKQKSDLAIEELAKKLDSVKLPN